MSHGVKALVFPAGLTEIHPHMKYQLATISRTYDSTLDKNLNPGIDCSLLAYLVLGDKIP